MKTATNLHLEQESISVLHFFAAPVPWLVDHSHLSNLYGTKLDGVNLIAPF